ncbi:DUF4233 domain-containing protein [Nocardioides speluncae]|uniref:DUF4233 domain-containing protein n=1 Tax=Nocardioides speluncae TaxID=2670337 RepID=UPI001F0C8554|nr:DUF4233 domain-containing protein [Nocardioides speluncae]
MSEEAAPSSQPPQRSPRRGMCAAILFLEAIVLGLTTPGMVTLGDVPLGRALVIGVGLCVLCIVVSGLLRAEWAYWLGWAIQVAAIALGFLVPMMFVLGTIFAILWGSAYFLGKKIERERAAAYAAYDDGASASG